MTSSPNTRWHLPPSAPALCALAAFVLLISPVAATLSLSDVSFTPNPPMVPAQAQHVSATIIIIPSGGTTFASGHEIQLLTNLEKGQWIIQVMVDGIPAARQTAQGNAAFINGVALAYSTTRDVSIVIDVEGTVPADAGPNLMVIQAEELDNNGSIVPGSVITITQSTTVPTTTQAIPTIPPVTPARTTPTTPSPTKSPGFTLLGGLVALCIVPVIASAYHSWEHNRR